MALTPRPGRAQADCAAVAARVEVAHPIFRPHHYARYVIEPITFIMANKLPFDIGSIVKYVLRYDAKNGVEDLKKARRFIDIRIETLEREAKIAAGEPAASVWSSVI